MAKATKMNSESFTVASIVAQTRLGMEGEYRANSMNFEASPSKRIEDRIGVVDIARFQSADDGHF